MHLDDGATLNYMHWGNKTRVFLQPGFWHFLASRCLLSQLRRCSVHRGLCLCVQIQNLCWSRSTHTSVNVQHSRKCFGEQCCGCSGGTEDLAGSRTRLLCQCSVPWSVLWGLKEILAGGRVKPNCWCAPSCSACFTWKITRWKLDMKPRSCLSPFPVLHTGCEQEWAWIGREPVH